MLERNITRRASDLECFELEEALKMPWSKEAKFFRKDVGTKRRCFGAAACRRAWVTR